MKKTDLCHLLGIELPLIQAGMVWVSGAKLAAASANAGCLGVIGAGSMYPELLSKQIKKAQALTEKPLAVNFPLLYKQVEEQIQVALENNIKIFIMSAGSPKKYTQFLKEKGKIVIHVTSSPELALKCEDAGVDAVIIEGFEAGGHNGRDELTSMVLIPKTVGACKIPVIAAGGFACGASVAAALAMGAQAVQMGTRFMMTKESSAHLNYKNLLLTTGTESTKLMMKKLVPVRLVKNKFYTEIQEMEDSCADLEKMRNHLGRGRAKLGMLDGNIDDGELEAGQVCGNILDISSVDDVVKNIKREYDQAILRLS